MQENAFENFVCKMGGHFSWPQYVNTNIHSEWCDGSKPLPEPMLTYHPWSVVVFMHLRVISQEVLMNSIRITCSKITLSKLHKLPPGANELNISLILKCIQLLAFIVAEGNRMPVCFIFDWCRFSGHKHVCMKYLPKLSKSKLIRSIFRTSACMHLPGMSIEST